MSCRGRLSRRSTRRLSMTSSQGDRTAPAQRVQRHVARYPKEPRGRSFIFPAGSAPTMRRRHLAVMRTSTAPCRPTQSTCLSHSIIRPSAGTIRWAAPPRGSGFWKFASKGVVLETRPSRYAATCGRASWLATCRAAARRCPPGRSAVSGCQWHSSGVETVSNTCPCIGSFAPVDEKSFVRTRNPWHSCREVPGIDLRLLGLGALSTWLLSSRAVAAHKSAQADAYPCRLRRRQRRGPTRPQHGTIQQSVINTGRSLGSPRSLPHQALSLQLRR